jgi:hypothetical protein
MEVKMFWLRMHAALLTYAGIMCGFVAVLCMLSQEFLAASILMPLGFVCCFPLWAPSLVRRRIITWNQCVNILAAIVLITAVWACAMAGSSVNSIFPYVTSVVCMMISALIFFVGHDFLKHAAL